MWAQIGDVKSGLRFKGHCTSNYQRAGGILNEGTDVAEREGAKLPKLDVYWMLETNDVIIARFIAEYNYFFNSQFLMVSLEKIDFL